MPPTVLARAAADRFTFDTANLKYLASQLPPGSDERRLAEGDWTVRQALAHLAVILADYAEILADVRTGVPLEGSHFDPISRNAKVAAEHSETPLPAILDTFDRNLKLLLAELALLDESVEARTIGLYGVGEMLRAWSAHAVEHALEVIEVLPELQRDLMLLNWLLFEPSGHESRHATIQGKLLEALYAGDAEFSNKGGLR